jgi:hypothetical protein
MRLVRVDGIGDGMELARDVPSPALASAPLLRRGVRLSRGVGATLERRGVRAVWIEDDLGEGIVPVQPLPEEVRRSAERAVITRLDGWVDWRGQRRFDSVSTRMTEMAMGLLVHDIGKISLPDGILNKPGPLDVEEWALVRTHPSAGASLLPADRVSPLSIAIVRDHHERWDGDGYEAGRAAEEIHAFARIAAVADVYDAITADRPYKAANPPHVGVRTIQEGAGSQFDPAVVAHFLQLAMPHPVGSEVLLPDGETGVLARVDPQTPEVPVVRHLDPTGRLCESELHIVDGVVQGVRQGLYN